MFDDSSSHRLVGKFFTSSTPPSLYETEQSLRKQWVLSGDMTVQKLGEDSDTLLFKFRQKSDKERVLSNGPFYVNGVIIVIKDPVSSDVIDFTVASFCVVVVGLPPYFLTKENFPALQSQVGDNNPVFSQEINENNNITICFLVEVDLKKPLRPGFYVEEGKRFVEFKYRNLGDFCYGCGMIGHVKRSCDKVRFPKERALNATSRTHVYGPWLRAAPFEMCYESVLMKSPEEKQNGVRECEKTLSYAQFFIELEFNSVCVCDAIIIDPVTESTHRFRFPCSYLETKTESTDFTPTTPKAHEVIRREIYENTPFSLDEWNVTGSLVEQLKLIKRNEFRFDDKWLSVKLQINRTYKPTPVDYETMLEICGDLNREHLIESKISGLIKKRVEENKNLLSLSSWEDQIRKAISEMGFTRYMPHSYVSSRAAQAMMEAVQMEVSPPSTTIPADRSTVCGLERFVVLGPDMDRLDPCVICAEVMFLAEEATVLPCSHVFHSSCIEKWLQVGHKCPLCGFELPSQQK